MWLLEPSVFSSINAAYLRGAAPTPQAEQEYIAAFFDSEDSSPAERILTIAGNVAEIAVSGVLTDTPSFMSFMFGGGNTTYTQIIEALAIVEQDSAVNDVILAIDSPGGMVAGLFDALDAINAFGKPIRAIVGNQAASAAYAIAAVAGSIEASGRSSSVGSIGVMAMFFVETDEITIRSTDAPNKNPDVTTEAGQQTIRAQLDSLHELFVEDIAKGRGITAAEVNENFGKGGIFLAKEGLEAGMIDTIAKAELNFNPINLPNTSSEASTMDINQLKAENRDVYDAVFALGKNAERDRVQEHVILGEAAGDMATALTAIKDGTGVNGVMRATYQAASMRNQSIDARQTDESDADAVLAAAAKAETSTKAEAVEAKVAALVAEKFGVAKDA